MSKYIVIETTESGKSLHYGPFANHDKATDYLSRRFWEQNPTPFSAKDQTVFMEDFKIKSLCPVTP